MNTRWASRLRLPTRLRSGSATGSLSISALRHQSCGLAMWRLNEFKQIKRARRPHRGSPICAHTTLLFLAPLW